MYIDRYKRNRYSDDIFSFRPLDEQVVKPTNNNKIQEPQQAKKG